MDVVFFRDTVLEIILGGKHIEREVCELRYNLFLRAASFYFNQNKPNCEVLEPFPNCFYDFAKKQRLYDELKLCISGIPYLSEMNVRIEFDWTK